MSRIASPPRNSSQCSSDIFVYLQPFTSYLRFHKASTELVRDFPLRSVQNEINNTDYIYIGSTSIRYRVSSIGLLRRTVDL
jgi:hypothetical protein